MPRHWIGSAFRAGDARGRNFAQKCTGARQWAPVSFAVSPSASYISGSGPVGSPHQRQAWNGMKAGKARRADG